MNIVALFDCAGLLIIIALISIFFIKDKRILIHAPFKILLALVIVKFFHFFSNTLEWSGITTALDPFEDYVTILEPMLWIFFLYSYLQLLQKKEIRKNKDTYRLLVENQNDLIVKFDPEGRLLFVSPTYCKTFGKTRDELLGTKFMPLIHEDDRERIAASLQDCFKEPHMCYHEERELTAEGFQWFAWSNKAVVDDAGQVSEVIAVGRNITIRKEAEDKLKQALVEKETLLKEVHHRVKNNMFVLYSLITLQQKSLNGNGNNNDILEDTKHRIRAIGKVHQMIYQTPNLSNIDFTHYIKSLSSEILNTYNTADTNIDVSFDVDPIKFNIDIAVPFGLIINELLVNVIKHAFPDRKKGHIWLSLKVNDDLTQQLQIKDDGIGIADDPFIEEPKTLGLKLVTLLALQLKGKVSYKKQNGSIFSIKFKNTQKDIKPA